MELLEATVEAFVHIAELHVAGADDGDAVGQFVEVSEGQVLCVLFEGVEFVQDLSA